MVCTATKILRYPALKGYLKYPLTTNISKHTTAGKSLECIRVLREEVCWLIEKIRGWALMQRIRKKGSKGVAPVMWKGAGNPQTFKVCTITVKLFFWL